MLKTFAHNAHLNSKDTMLQEKQVVIFCVLILNFQLSIFHFAILENIYSFYYNLGCCLDLKHFLCLSLSNLYLPVSWKKTQANYQS